MKKGKIIYGLIVLCFITACATPVPVRQSIENLSNPELETITTKSIGDILLSQGVRSTYPAIEILQDIGGLFGGNTIVKGIYIGVSQRRNNIIFRPSSNDVHMNEAIGEYFLAYSNNELRLAWYGGFGNLVRGRTIDQNYYKKTTAPIESSSDFQQTLIYTGRTGNVIRMTYREFSGNLARPAFTIDVTYDLSDSDIIAFREARLQVIEATNVSIQYKVLSNFN
jgi:hypothetical protein